jgi:site-specific DNA-adenine methylase
MKNHFFIGYAGNKRNECEEIYKELHDKIDDITTIVEPFCGSSAISFYISKLHPLKYKYILNDNDKYLIESYETFRDDEKLKKFIEKLNIKCKDLTKETYNTIIKEDNLEAWFIKRKIYSIRPGLFRLDYKYKDLKFLLDTPIINFLRTENIEFTNTDGIEVIKKYKDDSSTLMILDPPYLELCNDFYNSSNINVYEYLYYNRIVEMNCKIILILNDSWIIKLLFLESIKKTYCKLYQPNKRRVNHLIISNFNIIV